MAKELPKNWVETDLKSIIAFVIGGDWGKDPNKVNDKEFIEVACIRGSEIKNWERNKGATASLRKIKRNSLEKRELQEGDILLEISGGGPDQPVGRILHIDNESLSINELPKVCTNFLRLVRISDLLNKKFISLYLHYFYLSGEVIKYQGGSNNLRNLKFKDYQTINIPLPPLAEQERIVAKLDSLFKRLDKIKASLAKIPKLLQNFRQQVLTQAVTGKLTEVKVEKKRLGDYLSDVKYGTSKKSSYGTAGTPVLRIPNIKDGQISDEDMKFSILEQKELDKLSLVEGDVLLIRSNGSVSIVGRSAIVAEVHQGFTYAGYLIRLRCKEGLIPSFLNFSLQSNFMRAQIVETARSTSGVNNINSTEIKNLNILLPSKKTEQLEIVNRIQFLFQKADKILEKYELLSAKVEQLPQAILHKAFKGELVSQLETDGDARDLLKEIEGLKAESLLKKASGRRKAIKDFGKEYTLDRESQLKVAEEKETYKE